MDVLVVDMFMVEVDVDVNVEVVTAAIVTNGGSTLMKITTTESSSITIGELTQLIFIT